MNFTGAESIRWDLSDLYPTETDLQDDLVLFEPDAEAFNQQYHGRVQDLEAADLSTALDEFSSLQDRIGRAFTYAYLNWSTDTGDPSRGKLLQQVREIGTQAGKKLLFLDLEWMAIDDDVAGALLASPELDRYHHYLDVQRLQKKHVLTEAEEQVLAETAVTGSGAWTRFFDESLGAATFELNGETLSEQEVLSKLHDSDRDLRKAAAFSLTEGLESNLRTLTFVYNTILADKASNDRMRKHESWLSARNISNEVDDATVAALVGAVSDRFDISARFYELKKRLLGFDEMFDYDRYAPLEQGGLSYSWSEAREVVLQAYEAFHPELGAIAGRFFEGNWIDAAVSSGKRGGAFSHGAVPSAHPYILMNFTGKIRDVQTLAHELGHGVHQYLSRDQGVLHADTPLTTAETASVFGEMLVFSNLLERESDPKARLSMIVSKIDDSMATVFRQVSMHRFEDEIHAHRREKGELTSDEFSQYWFETQRDMFGGNVTLGDHYRIWWSYIPHFIHTPGYVYAYAFGELLVLALYARYREVGDSFAGQYLDLLRAGGSDWPHVLIGRLGIDLTDPGFWGNGLKQIEAMIGEAEALSSEQ
ncbi:MAG: M3 family oligoendopeptidase [Rhodothermia bacterium]